MLGVTLRGPGGGMRSEGSEGATLLSRAGAEAPPRRPSTPLLQQRVALAIIFARTK